MTLPNPLSTAQPIALVTGGARRVGAAISRRLSEAGYAVIVHANTSFDEARALVADIEEKGGKAYALAVDLSNTSARDQCIVRASNIFGPLSLLVNNAAVFHSDTLMNFTDASFDVHMKINLLTPIALARDFAAHALNDHDASIVNIIDHRVLKPTPQYFTYTLSKAALHTATLTMAQALAPRIRVNAVGPGPTLPNMHDGEDGLKQEAAGVPLGRAVDPREIAEAVLYLARARSVTGEMIAVDSGQHIGWKTPDIIMK
jgi:NAD(P)-dependent dehydrogenase (short-subunit alcohol dehydrogenase family)